MEFLFLRSLKARLDPCCSVAFLIHRHKGMDKSRTFEPVLSEVLGLTARRPNEGWAELAGQRRLLLNLVHLVT